MTQNNIQIDRDEFEQRKQQSSSSGMERVTFRVPPGLLEIVDTAVECGEYPNRSEALRAAVRAQFRRADGGHPSSATTTAGQSTTDPTPAAPAQTPQWRLHYYVGELAHYTAWTDDFATVENLYHQYRRGDYGHDVTIERRAEVSADD